MKHPKEVDGIYQADNPMPYWWTTVFLLTILFSIFYTIYFHYFSDWPQERAFVVEVEEHEKKYSSAKKQIVANPDGSNPFRDNDAAVADGQALFVATCAACHKADGTGQVGPNLMDNEWLHGNTDAEIYNVIANGIVKAEELKLKRGPMPSHKGLGDEKIYKIMAWLAKNNPSLKPKKEG